VVQGDWAESVKRACQCSMRSKSISSR
jgi:hypothetical protein